MSKCSYNNCTNVHMAKGLCKLHYYRKKKGQPMDAERRQYYVRQGDFVRDKYNRVMITIECPRCKEERLVLRCLAAKHPLCKGCAAKNRAEKYMAENGRGQQWKGSKYFSGKIISGWKRGAADRNITWDISNDELDNLYDEQGGLCAYTGVVLSFNDGDKAKVSLDRIDSTLPYTIDNVQLTCAYVNICKQSLTDEEFVAMCRLVVNNR